MSGNEKMIDIICCDRIWQINNILSKMNELVINYFYKSISMQALLGKITLSERHHIRHKRFVMALFRNYDGPLLQKSSDKYYQVTIVFKNFTYYSLTATRSKHLILLHFMHIL